MLDGEASGPPLGEAAGQTAGRSTVANELTDSLVGVDTERSPAVGDDLHVLRKRIEVQTHLVDRNRTSTSDVAGCVLDLRSDIEHDGVACPEPIRQLIPADDVDAVAATQVGVREPVEILDVVRRHRLDKLPQRSHPFARQGIEDPVAVSTRRDQPGTGQHMEMVRCVGHALVEFERQRLDVAFALGEDIDQLDPPTVGQRLAHLGKPVEQTVFGHSITHNDLHDSTAVPGPTSSSELLTRRAGLRDYSSYCLNIPMRVRECHVETISIVGDSAGSPGPRQIRLGLRENLAQFGLLVGVNALVGGMIGQERTVLPLLAEDEFGLTAFTATLTFIAAFGAVKAITNFFAGTLSDRYGRKPVLVTGWLFALPVPIILIWAPSWEWVIVANVFLGINQGLAWSTTVIMKIDLVGPGRRGFAMGLNEAAGYGAVAATALATGWIADAHGLRPAPFFLGLVFAGLGLGISTLFVRETRDHARLEATNHDPAKHATARHDLGTRDVFVLTSFTEKALSSASQAGLVNNLNDGLAWGLFPIFFAAGGLSIGRIGVLAAIYPAVWGLGQLVTGGLSDRIGRKPLIAGGMLTQATAIAMIAATSGFWPWALGAALLGAGTAMVYPTLLAAIGDVAHPNWRARSVGVYRLWRDGGFAVGALVAGLIADAASIEAAIWAVAALTAASGVIVMARMYETHPPLATEA